MIEIGGFFGIGDRYTISKELGNGGMGTVYKAFDNILKEVVAIKCLNKEYASDDVVKNRFLNEAKICLNLTHPNIIRVRDVNIFEDIYFIVMEYIDGVELKYFFGDDRKDIEKIYTLIFPILESLAYAHKYTVHRDIKPSNIMIKDNKPYLMDFGISKALEDSELTNYTQSGGMGTKKYVSPEQTFNANDVDQRTDIYSMGVLLYELFTQIIPKNTAVVKPENPSKYNESISPFLNRVILKMIEPKATDRYDDFNEVITALNEAIFNKKNIVTHNHLDETLLSLKCTAINKKNFVLIEAGNFLRGAGVESQSFIDKPRKSIYLDQFYISKYCVTNQEYNEFVENMQYKKPLDFDEFLEKKPTHPVVNVSFEDAIAYCTYKNCTLPTEAQWEKAAKGGKNYIYPWGNSYNPHLLNIEYNINDTVAVDSFEDGISEDGIFNLAGNVWEWCLDDFIEDFYKGDDIENPCANADGDIKVLRGGAFDFVQNSAKTSFRFHEKKDKFANNIGFRVVSR
jgi:serine/threonine protein kinase